MQALCSITVAEILECASTQQAVVLHIFEKPTTNNQAHAEIVGFKKDLSDFLDIPRSIGAKIIKKQLCILSVRIYHRYNNISKFDIVK